MARAEKLQRGELVTQSEYARRRNLNRSTVSRAVKRGVIPVHGERGLIDVAQADRAREANTDPAQVIAGNAKPAHENQGPKGGNGAGNGAARGATNGSRAPAVNGDDSEDEGETSVNGMTYTQARARREVLKYQKEELEFRKARDELVDRALAKRILQEMAQASSKAWTQWPARVYAEMAAELGVDGALLHQVLDRHVREHLEEISQADVEFRE